MALAPGVYRVKVNLKFRCLRLRFIENESLG